MDKLILFKSFTNSCSYMLLKGTKQKVERERLITKKHCCTTEIIYSLTILPGNFPQMFFNTFFLRSDRSNTQSWEPPLHLSVINGLGLKPGVYSFPVSKKTFLGELFILKKKEKESLREMTSRFSQTSPLQRGDAESRRPASQSNWGFLRLNYPQREFLL